jgi:hypothetical protein
MLYFHVSLSAVSYRVQGLGLVQFKKIRKSIFKEFIFNGNFNFIIESSGTNGLATRDVLQVVQFRHCMCVC